MKSTATKRPARRGRKVLLTKASAEEILAAHRITPAEIRRARAAVAAASRRRTAAAK